MSDSHRPLRSNVNTELPKEVQLVPEGFYLKLEKAQLFNSNDSRLKEIVKSDAEQILSIPATPGVAHYPNYPLATPPKAFLIQMYGQGLTDEQITDLPNAYNYNSCMAEPTDKVDLDPDTIYILMSLTPQVRKDDTDPRYLFIMPVKALRIQKPYLEVFMFPNKTYGLCYRIRKNGEIIGIPLVYPYANPRVANVAEDIYDTVLYIPRS